MTARRAGQPGDPREAQPDAAEQPQDADPDMEHDDEPSGSSQRPGGESETCMVSLGDIMRGQGEHNQLAFDGATRTYKASTLAQCLAKLSCIVQVRWREASAVGARSWLGVLQRWLALCRAGIPLPHGRHAARRVRARNKGNPGPLHPAASHRGSLDRNQRRSTWQCGVTPCCSSSALPPGRGGRPVAS